MLSTITLTRKERDCIVLIGEHGASDFPLRLIEVANSMKVKPPTALNLIKRLVGKGMLKREKGMLMLTNEGKVEYGRIMESHRVIETMMARYGVSVDEACRLSCNLDFIMDEDSVNRIFTELGRPKVCPHGKKIEVVQ